jgi:tetratricopeptide (TPR) repeat protein
MAKKGLLALVSASFLAAAAPAVQSIPAPADDPDKAMATTLAVQMALQRGKEHLLRGEYAAAVDVLESQLAHIDGNRGYLIQLKDAYRGYIKELRLAKHDNEAKRYLNRLQLLDRGAILDSALTGTTGNSSSPSAPPTRPPSPPAKTAENPATKITPTVRAKSDEESAQLLRLGEPSLKDARSLLAKAEEEFGGGRYKEARLLYEQAYQSDPSIAKSCAERWAYCKLSHVVDQLNRPAAAKPQWPELEQEIRGALTLAPRLAEAKEIKELLTEVQRRRGSTPQAAGNPQSDLPVRNLAPNAEGWKVAESANFRIFHQSQALAEQAAQVAERTRANMQQKWFGGGGDGWIPKCDIYLHPTADAYSRATGQQNSPGHSTLRMENGRLVLRRIDLHCDDANMLPAVLPHETTHVVLAGQFGQQLLPRWADEGMAVLTEPPEKVERHLANLNKCRKDGQALFPLQELMQLDDYPRDPRSIGAFYAQSVSLVEYLTNLRGPQTFTLFMLDGMRYGYEKSLQRHYNIQNFADLERGWSEQASRERANLSSMATR